MKKSLRLFLLVGGVFLFSATGIIAAPDQGLLVSETGEPIPGYSTVIIENGLAYPVRNLETNTWYSVIVTGTAADGTNLCILGEPLETIPEGVGVDEGGSDEEEVDDDSDPSRPGE